MFKISKVLVFQYKIIRDVKFIHCNKFNIFFSLICFKILIFYIAPRAPPVDSKNESIGGKKVKKENIDGYEVYSENGEFKKMIFKDYLGNEICVSIEQCLKIELLQRRKEEYAEDYRVRRYIDTFLNDEYLLEVKFSNKIATPEEIILAEDGQDRIIKEIWNLPEPQNRRVYMYIVDEFSLTKIAKIENRAIPVIKRSIDRGILILQKKFKKFYNKG